MKSLTELPIEILTIIVRMARDQDQRLKTRLERSRERVLTATKEVLKLSEWYGISLLALHASCKTLEALAKPFVFETVKLSKSSQDLFLDHILPNYASLIKSIVFDALPGNNLSSVFKVFMISMQSMPSVYYLTFETKESISELESFYLRSQATPLSPANAAEHGCRPLFASLRKQVTQTTCLKATYLQMRFIATMFPQLRSVKRRLDPSVGSTANAEGDLERESYAALKHLRHIDISTITHQGEIGWRAAKLAPEDFYWSGKWMSTEWTMVTTLYVTCWTFTGEEWELLKTFRLSLEHLQLNASGIFSEFYDTPSDATEFPKLRKLAIVGDHWLAEKLLRLLKMAPIVVLDLKMVSTSVSEVIELLKRKEDEDEDVLKPLLSTLRLLELDDLALPYLSGVFKDLEERLSKNAIEFRCGKVADESRLYFNVDEATSSLNANVVSERSKRVFSIQEIGLEVKDVLGYAMHRTDRALEEEDAEEINRLATILRPMAAKKFLEWE